ncbi:ubiquitin carboxy-terminal hydrolase, putative [Bodo saltans]|uniref:Ubiquitin carboxy-terminal hydrolase, putative n=1 Tax=Bodo saltans TaxID=75058 RepID=A0A0S4IUC4_BODSA|nr:ubiquitin carboxy-terminal hydrolase, putative [Bodo saltans]|eukprot:CUF90790.1 ubiquitin carboxy-terminal hydrolase, putative [Bodo saltans]
MNSGLQCLSNIPKFRRAMLESHLSTISPPFATPLVFQFVQLLRDLWRSDDNSQSLTQRSCRYAGSSSVNPVGFKEAIGAKCGRFAGYEQQDAIELVEVLLDRMHHELNPLAGKKFRERRDDDSKIPVQQLSKLYWNDHLRNNDSAITRLFYRQERTRFECLECGHKATVFDAQSSLPVPVGEELYLSLDVLVMLNPLDAFTSSLVTSQQAADDTNNANAYNEEKQRQQQQYAQSPVQTRSSAMTAEVSSEDIDRVQIRIRVPMDSSNSVIAAEVRRVLIEGNFISNQDEDKKSVILMHQVSPVAGYALLGNYHVPLKRIDEKRFLAVITPSIALLDPPPPPPPAESSGDTTTAATAPQQPLKKEEVGPQLQSPGVRVKFIFKVQATPSSYTTTRSSSGVTVSAAAIEDDNSITTAATLPFAQFSVFPRSTVTNRMIWAACRRAVARYTCVNTTRTTSDDEGGSSSPTHNTNGNEEGTASTAGSSSGLATSNLFTVGLQLGAYAGAPETAVPVNDEGLALPQYFNDNMIARVVITLTRPQVAGPPFLELRSLPVPLEHDTMLSVISNDESDSQRQKDGGLTLEKALSNMIETHVLKDDDAWYCPVCKTHRESTTEAAQFLLPEVLTIHLKRFKTTNYGAMNKINTVVQFPLELDMSPFIAEDSPRHAITSSIESSNSAENSPAKSISNTNSQTNRNRTAAAAAAGGLTSVPSSAFSSAREPMKYELTGVVYHSGSLTFGHYTAQAFCEGADSWVYYNDSSAYATTERPSPENAYILFYQRVDADAPPRPPAYFGSAATKPTAEKEVVEATPSYATAPPATTVVDDLYDLPS